MIHEELRTRLERALGARVVDAKRVHGGDVHRAYRIRLDEGMDVFVKTTDRPPPGVYRLEAEGLRWLSEAGALRVPRVLAVDDGPHGFLALEWIACAPPARDFDEALGRGLAMLHRAGAPSFGLAHDNYLATLLQTNARQDDWPSFYAHQRLAPLLARVVDLGLASARIRSGLARVIAEPAAFCGAPEPPSRLHGDLWSGNVLADERGRPVLIDPAVYGGHREVDLAMMRLFGGFGDRCFAAYAEAHPLAEGAERRVALYQLLPLLVHVVLFGGGYVAGVERALDRLGV